MRSRPLGDRAEDLLLRDLLARALVRGSGGATPGQDDDRQRADEGFGDAGHEVGRARAGGDAADAGLAGELRVSGRHVGRDLLVPHQDVADLGGVVESVIDRQRVATRNAEHRLTPSALSTSTMACPALTGAMDVGFLCVALRSGNLRTTPVRPLSKSNVRYLDFCRPAAVASLPVEGVPTRRGRYPCQFANLQPRALFDVQGRSAVVTGGAQGLGLAYAEVLAANGADVVLLDANRAVLEPRWRVSHRAEPAFVASQSTSRITLRSKRPSPVQLQRPAGSISCSPTPASLPDPDSSPRTAIAIPPVPSRTCRRSCGRR